MGQKTCEFSAQKHSGKTAVRLLTKYHESCLLYFRSTIDRNDNFCGIFWGIALTYMDVNWLVAIGPYEYGI